MKKVVIKSPGSYDKLAIEESSDLEPKADEVLIKVRAIGVNFADVCVRLGVYESAKKYIGWPITPGFEVSGTIEKVGPEVKKYKLGDKVIAFTLFGGYSSQICVSEAQIIPLPTNFSLEEGAGFPAVFFTAYHALHHHVVFPKKDVNVLIHSAAGGVGTALTQICKYKGFNVVGVVGSSHKIDYLKKFGPDHIIDKSKQDLWGCAKKLVPEGFDAIFDANGYTTMKDSYNHLKPLGKLLVYGAHSFISKSGRINYFKAALGMLKMPSFKPFHMITNNLGVVGFNISFLFNEKQLIQECVNGLQELTSKGILKPIPVTEVPFDDVAEAHKLIQSGQSVGKIVLTIDQ